MCKISIIAGIKPENRVNAIKFVKKMAEIMSVSNSDGLGYAAVDVNGNLFAERWLNNKDAFVSKHESYDTDVKISNVFGKALKGKDISKTYTSHGTPDLNKMTAITLHTRLATSTRGMENTHPFIDDDTSVIHNGIINNHKDFKLTLSTCDSESILVSYLQNMVGMVPENIISVANSLVGYYACGMFARNEQGERVMDVFKGNNDDLYITYISELGTWVMASFDTHIKTACESLGFKHSTIFQMNDGFLMRFDPITGIQLLQQEFKVGSRYESTTHRNYDRGDYSARNHGAWEYNHKTGNVEQIGTANVTHLPKKNLTAEELEFLTLPPSITKVTDNEKFELLTAAGYWD